MNQYNWKTDSYENATEQIEKTTAKVRKAVGDYINFISLMLLILLQVLLPFITAGVRNPLSPNYIFHTICNTASTLMAYYMFIPNGHKDRMSLDDYGATVSRWNALSHHLSVHDLKLQFRDYCKSYSEEEARLNDARNLELLFNAGIDKDVFDKEYRTMTRRELKKRLKKGIVNKEQLILIRICQKPTRVSYISVNFVLSGSSSADRNSSLRVNSSYEKKKMVLKPITLLLFVVATSFFYPEQQADLDVLATICNIVVRIFSVCLSSFSGYRTGYKGIEYKMSDISCRSEFIEEFIETTKKEGT